DLSTRELRREREAAEVSACTYQTPTLFVRSCIVLPIRSLVCPVVPSSTRSGVRSFVRSSVHPARSDLSTRWIVRGTELLGSVCHLPVVNPFPGPIQSGRVGAGSWLS